MPPRHIRTACAVNSFVHLPRLAFAHGTLLRPAGDHGLPSSTPHPGPAERAREILPHIHRVFRNVKTWMTATHHGVGHDNLQLDVPAEPGGAWPLGCLTNGDVNSACPFI